VVKVGGSVLSDASWLEGFAGAVASSSSPLVIVHGGGPEINELAGRLGVEFTWVDGRRVTSPEVLDAAQMVLSGRINKRLVTSLLEAGVDAVGLSGVDGGLVTATVRDGGALGLVGSPATVRPAVLLALLAAGMTPVVSPISRGAGATTLNVNADEVATGVAVALGASELLYLTDVAAVRDGETELSAITPAQAGALVASGRATGGMAVKLEAARQALAGGVPCVRIGPLGVLEHGEAGTAVRSALEALV
jgi:acetylglutamate kinase